ncbi:MAG: hypothetical protein GWQ08_25080 [Verrucomicrobiaceae bacterium]|nr:hypothetical protein [Verrucomicrobiaceae bacterium]
MPPFAPGESATITLTLGANNRQHRYLSFASMVILSNDAFIGNSDPMAYPIFDESGNVILSAILRLGAQIYDAGTEVNDETPANTAFFGQAAPDTGVTEGGVIALHTGFDPANSGGILGTAMFANADFTADDYSLLRLGVGGGFNITEVTLVGDVYNIVWDGGRAPFQVQWSRNLQEWTDVGEVMNDRAVEIELLREDRAFFRVIQGAVTAPQTAMFELTFDSVWSAATHPTDFLAGTPHFSGLIGSIYNGNDSLWAPGGTTTPGIRNVAETGGKSPLDDEIEALISGGNTASVISGGGIGRSPGQVSVQFDADQDFPLLSLVSMIAPSPDWFVGIHDLALFENGQWIEEVVVQLHPYNAGTDNGETYVAPNATTTPQGEITRIVAPSPLAFDGVVAPFGTFTIRRIVS